MQTPHKNSRVREVLHPHVRVTQVRLSVSRSAEKPRGGPPQYEAASYLTLRAEADEPVGTVRDFDIQLGVDESRSPREGVTPAVGSIILVKPQVMAVIWVDISGFDRLWMMVTAGLLRHAWLSFERPHRGHALILSAYFTNESEEEDDESQAGGRAGYLPVR